MTVRHVPRPRLYLILVGFHLSVAYVVAHIWVLPEEKIVWQCLGRRQAVQDRFDLERERVDAVNAVSLQIKTLYREVTTLGLRTIDDARAHSLARENADYAGLNLKRFLAIEEEGEYLVTLEGSFGNAVKFADSLLNGLSPFRVRRFIARVTESRNDHIELELLIKKSPRTFEFVPSCVDYAG
jgi:hypothetical protein